MSTLNPEILNITLRQSITRKIPPVKIVILLLMYFCVAIFTFLGTMWGFPMLILSLGTLFFAWYYKGIITVHYEYQIDGYSMRIRRLSGTRSKPVNEEFCKLDLSKVITVVDQCTQAHIEMEEKFEAQPKSRRVTYYTSAHDADRPGVVLYAHGTDAEMGFLVRVYLQPSGQLLDTLRMLCPGKVNANGD